jgi:hypothetical protein
MGRYYCDEPADYLVVPATGNCCTTSLLPFTVSCGTSSHNYCFDTPPPRVIQKKWSRPSRLVVEVGSYQRDEVPMAHRSLLTSPLVLLLIPLHVRSLFAPRLDQAPPSALRLYH